jgi:hypothetical protein
MSEALELPAPQTAIEFAGAILDFTKSQSPARDALERARAILAFTKTQSSNRDLIHSALTLALMASTHRDEALSLALTADTSERYDGQPRDHRR